MNRAVLGLVAALAPASALADYRVHYPAEIDQGEVEIEHNGAASFDRKADQGGAQSYTLEFGTGLTPWWHSEIEFGFDRDPGFSQSTLFTQAVTENTFRFTEPGEYFADFAFYAEYGQSLAVRRHSGPNQVTFGPLIAKDIGLTTTTVNLLLTRLLGPNQGTHGLDFTYAWQTRWNLWAPLSPAVEFYGDAGTLGRSPRFAQQQLLAGPVGIGALSLHELGLGNAGKIRYEIGWLFGATSATPAGTLRWRIELEIPF